MEKVKIIKRFECMGKRERERVFDFCFSFLLLVCYGGVKFKERI